MADEKQPLIPSQVDKEASRRPVGATTRPDRFRTFLFVVLGCFLAYEVARVVVWHPSSWLSAHHHYHRHHHIYHKNHHKDHHRPQQWRQYAGESVKWHSCGDVAGRPVECSTIDVPMDQFSADNLTNKTFSIPLIRDRGQNATKNLLLNPGGPGGSGMEFMYRRGEQLRTIVGEGFHLLSFDPRGVNSSQPTALCYPGVEARRALSIVNDAKILGDSPELYAWTHNFVRACDDTMGEHGRYINTPQTAADMNSILEAVGQHEMVYWGFSYGTILGQTYAALFPERSHRVIIDGVANQFDWYEGLFDAESLADTENVLDGFFSECVKAGKDCPLSSLVASKDELRDRLMSLAYSLEEQPISVYVNNSNYGLLDFQKIMYSAIFPSLYKPANWYALADRLAGLLEGNATDAFLAYGGGDGFDMEGDSNTFVTMNDGATGPAHWPTGRQELLDKMLPILNQSLFGPTMNSEYYTKQQWRVPRTHSYVPTVGVETAHPLLILSTTYDPVCPLVSARSAKAAFKGSEIVEVKGYGHCSVAVASTCLAKRVREFLYDGTLPSQHTQCEVDGAYFVKPEQDGKVTALRAFDDAEDEKIHLAQLAMARDEKWPMW